MQEHYLTPESYWNLVDTLLNAEADFSLDRRDKVIYALGEIGNVWSEEWRPEEDGPVFPQAVDSTAKGKSPQKSA